MLAAHTDPVRAAGQQRYMRSAMPYRGIAAAELRALTRPLLADAALAPRSSTEWEATVQMLWDTATHREERYVAIALLGHRRYAAWLTPRTLPLLRHLVTSGAWWDYVDALAAHEVGTLLRTYRDEVTPVLRHWMVADPDEGAMWLRRTAILAQLSHRTETDTRLLADAVDANLETGSDGAPTPYGREFFIRKAVGWALRQYARTDPEWVRAFVAAHEDRMAPLSVREARKHL